MSAVGEWDVPGQALSVGSVVLTPEMARPAALRMGRGQPEPQPPKWGTHAAPLAKLPFICSGNQVQRGLSVPKEASRGTGGSSGGLGDCQQLPSSLARPQNHLPTGTRASGGSTRGQALCSLHMARQSELRSVVNT